MQQITLRSRVGEDGILHLDIPVGMKETDLEVTVMVKYINQNDRSKNQLLQELKELFKETQALHLDNPLTEADIQAEIDAYRRGE
ncbi:hypothetical protein C7H19_20850 [Aphanothece hegewaldii CCALA 016]|uniref:Uncharacterized protein n=1 Tax=Aphanothece hegewaldii CCALA 016 TaxID=2107694 RepID=A0A2T1LSW2_9CHRO|nr:hypothetical protein [Aphanothece hegewaldii]PSF33050.1 hypothetical protein C7H19_20850 [Aphanothece hegewaldii CCALA 016]